MKKFALFFIVLLAFLTNTASYAQITTLGISPNSTLLNKTSGAGALSNITITVGCGATPVNRVAVQISNSNGVFVNNPTTADASIICLQGNLPASSSTPFTCNIPFSTPNLLVYGGNFGYRFRIVYDTDNNNIYDDASYSDLIPAAGATNGFLLQELPTITVTAAALLPGGVVNTTFCEGSQVSFGIAPGSFSKTAGGNFGGSNTFYLDISDKFGNFTTNWYVGSSFGIGSIVSSSPNVIYGTIPSSLVTPITNPGYTAASNFGTGHQFRIRSSNPVAYSNVLTPYTIIQTPTAPVPAANTWYAYAYNDRVTPYIVFDKYAGYNTIGSALSFNTTNPSTYQYGTSGSPSEATGFLGCAVGKDYHSVRYERTGFTCGYYKFDIDADNNYKLYINGTLVSSKTTTGAVSGAWYCFLGPSTKVTLDVSDQSSTSKAILTLTAQSAGASLNNISNVTVCSGGGATLTASAVTGSNIGIGAMTYAWTLNSGTAPGTVSGASTATLTLGNITANCSYKVTATNTATGCTDFRTVNVTVGALSVSISASPSTTICPGGSTTLTASGATNYTWSPSVGLSATSGASVVASPVSTQTYTVTGSSPGCGSTPTSNVTVTVSGGIAAPTFGNGTWNVYAYSNNGSAVTNGFAVLLGMYTEPLLSYDTRNRWAANRSPSQASGYVGCTVPNDYHSYKYMRTNFTCGIYQITINGDDDNITLFVDGVQKFTRGTSSTATQVWRGFLGPNSTLEIRSVELTSNSYANVSVTLVPAITQNNPVVCINVPTTLSATTTPDGPEVAANTVYTWTPNGGGATVGMLSATNTSSVTFLANATPGSYTFRCTISNAFVGVPDGSCSVFSDITVTVINTAPTGAITPNPATICGGNSVTLTASGGISYKWYYLDSTKIKDGTFASAVTTNFSSQPLVWKVAGVAASYLNYPGGGSNAGLSSLSVNNGVVVANPPVSTRYGVEISVGGVCASGYATVDVFVGAPTNPSNFNNNVWYAYVYNGNNFQNYYGYYTVTAQSFDTGTRWSASSNPSTATGNNPATVGASTTAPGVRYVGCPLPSNDNFSIDFKRRGFTCGFYQISYPSYDDDINLRVGATDAAGTVLTPMTTVTGFPKTYSGSAANNVWQGFLGPNSQIQTTLREYSGNAGMNIQLLDISASVSANIITSPAAIVCRGSTTVLTASVPATDPSSLTYTWTASTADITFPSGNTGTSVTALVAAAGANGIGVNITCTVTDANAGGCVVSQTITSLIYIDNTETTTLTQDKTSVCTGEVVTFTAAGANLYSWTFSSTSGDGTVRFPNATGTVNPATTFTISGSPMSFNSTAAGNYGSVALFTPGLATAYNVQVLGKTGAVCSAGTASATLNIINILTPDPGYGDQVWNVVCYNGNSPIISSFASGSIGSNVRGYYREEELSFNTEARWDKTLAPSTTTVNTPATCPNTSLFVAQSCGYVGCPVDNDYHTIIYKRTQIPCNIYRIDIGDFSNALKLDLIINGVTVFTSPGLTQKFNAWNGSLSPNDKIEIRYYATTGNSYFSVNFAVIPPPASSVIWTGGAGNNQWKDANNWCAGLPEKVTDVFIPIIVAGSYPIVESSKAITVPNECRNMNIAAGASLTVNANFELSVYGNWVNNGTFSSNPSSVVRFQGLDSVNIGGSSPTAFGRLQLNKGGSIVSLGNNVTVNTSLDLTNAQMQLNGKTLTINTSSPDSVFRSNGSFVLSETNTAYNPSIMCWNLSGAAAGKTFEFPFGTSFSNYIPVFFTKNTADNYTICTSTRATGADNKPYAQNQTATWTATVADASLMIDRWWDITSTMNPLPGAGANIALTYDASSNTLPGTTTQVRVFHYDPAGTAWDPAYTLATNPVSSGTGTAGANNINKFSPHLVGDENAALPVSLVDFSAKIANQQVTLQWETASELNNDYFIVERSTDAKNFETVAKVKSKQSNSNDLTAYSALDDKPYYGVSYYRLKEVDLDGLTSYSRVLSVEIGSTLELVLAPNPATVETARILVMGESNTEVKFSMKDINGRPVFSQIISIDEGGRAEVQLPAGKSLTSGVYICTIQVGTKTISKKLVIQ